MLSWLFALLFECRHRHCTFPISTRAGEKADPRLPRGPYVVCLDCARKFAYDWEKMRIVWAPQTSGTGSARLPRAQASVSRPSS